MDDGDHRQGPSPSDDVIGDLTRWLAEARVDAAASSRARERWLRQQLDEEATLAGVLLDLAERGDAVVLHSRSGRRHRGLVRAVADEFCALRSADGTDHLLAFDGLLSVEPHQSPGVSSGSRPAALDMTWREALLSLAGQRRRLLLLSGTGTTVAGELRSVGRDVVVLRPDGEPRALYVPLAAVVAAVLTD